MTARKRVLAAAVAATILIGFAPGATSDAAAPKPWERAPNLNEYSLLALANTTRAEPAVDGYGQYPAVPPLAWNDDLGTAARWYIDDRITTNSCNPPEPHSSCNGELWWRRINRFYSGYSALGENINAVGVGPRAHHLAWLGSPGHRGNILSPNYNEFGAATQVDRDGVLNPDPAIEDFGGRSGAQIPVIPAGAVLFPEMWNQSQWDWDLLVNYYRPGQAPTRVDAYVDGVPQPLTLIAGTNTQGSWGGTLRTSSSAQQPCRLVHFEIRSGGATFRWPAAGDIRVGHWSNCWDPFAPLGSAAPPPTTTTTTASTTTTRPGVGAPTVVILKPLAGGVSGVVQIRATATDDGIVKTIEVYVDNKRLVRKQGGSVTRAWDTRPARVASGPHTITVKAYDNEGNVGTTSVVVTK